MEHEKLLLSGNEAIARGAYEAGVRLGTGYPGTPSTEILESLISFKEVAAEWSVNEKVAYEVAHGAALSGARSIVTMKHVGLNVAADPLFSSVYTGVKAGLVVVTADDPGMHSSQNEQDNRNYAYAAKLPMLEPSDSQEAKDFTKLAFDLSEKFDTPVLLRTTTRISHAKGIVATTKRHEKETTGFTRDFPKHVMIPNHARLRHNVVEERLGRIGEAAGQLGINTVELNDKKTGFITSGVCYNYLKEVFPEASVLKLGMVYPLPEKLIRDFAGKVEKLYILEELDPFIELRVKAMGIECEGKLRFSNIGEFSPDTIKQAFGTGTKEKTPIGEIPKIPPRFPALCPGCPHRTVFTILGKMDVIVSGDIGCYSLGVLPPFNALDTCIDMGWSITGAQGIEVAGKNNVVAVLGDSTFAHSGITGLLNASYNKRRTLVIVLDNSTTAMTGMQPNPASGRTLSGEQTVAINYGKLAESIGIGAENFMEVNAFKSDEVEKAINELTSSGKLSLLVVKGKCIILAKKGRKS
jgi:indolepyruvate ferredoxin oxidoreductase alpha subunit